MRRAAILLAATAALASAGCGSTRTEGAEPDVAAPGRSTSLVDTSKPAPYVNDLAVDPADGALLLTTNTGFYRVVDGKAEPVRGTVTAEGGTAPIGTFLELSAVGPGTYLGSGHPDEGGADLPEFLGVIRSDDAGRTWTPVSRLGDADVHKYVERHDRLYGWDAVLSAIIISKDGGRTFEERFTPRGLILDFEVDPEEPKTIVASNEQQLFRTDDGGQSWRALEAGPGIRLAWPREDLLLRAGDDGRVWRSKDDGTTWEEVGQVQGVPADFDYSTAGSPEELLLALADGSVIETKDGGASWTSVFQPS